MGRLATVRPDGTGSIKPRGNRFRAQYVVKDEWVNGKRDRKFTSRTFDTEKAAEEWLRGQLTDRDRDEWVEPSKLTISGLMDKWLSIKEPKLSPNTYKEYESIIRNRINHPAIGIGHVLVQKLTAARIDEFYSAMRKPGANSRTTKPTRISETSIKRTHEVLTGALAYAQSRALLIKNPCELAEKPKANKAKPKAWNAGQLKAFLAQEDRICKVGPLWQFLAHTGVRLSEALGLLWGDDVNLTKNYVSIKRRNIRLKGQREMLEVEGTKTEAGTRRIALDASIVLALKEWKLAQGHGGQGLVFPFHCDAVDREFARRVATAQVPDYGIHGIRHTMATLWIHEMGISVKTVSERLGHTSVAFTMDQYGQSPEGAQAAAAAAFSNFLAAAQ